MEHLLESKYCKIARTAILRDMFMIKSENNVPFQVNRNHINYAVFVENIDKYWKSDKLKNESFEPIKQLLFTSSDDYASVQNENDDDKQNTESEKKERQKIYQEYKILITEMINIYENDIKPKINNIDELDIELKISLSCIYYCAGLIAVIELEDVESFLPSIVRPICSKAITYFEESLLYYNLSKTRLEIAKAMSYSFIKKSKGELIQYMKYHLDQIKYDPNLYSQQQFNDLIIPQKRSLLKRIQNKQNYGSLLVNNTSCIIL